MRGCAFARARTVEEEMVAGKLRRLKLELLCGESLPHLQVVLLAALVVGEVLGLDREGELALGEERWRRRVLVGIEEGEILQEEGEGGGGGVLVGGRQDEKQRRATAVGANLRRDF